MSWGITAACGKPRGNPRAPTATALCHSGTGVSVCGTGSRGVLCWCLPGAAARSPRGRAGRTRSSACPGTGRELPGGEAAFPALYGNEGEASGLPQPSASRSLPSRPAARRRQREAHSEAWQPPRQADSSWWDHGLRPTAFFLSGTQLHGAEGLFFPSGAGRASRPSQNPRRVRACSQSPRLSAPAALPPPVRPSVLVVSRNCSC